MKPQLVLLSCLLAAGGCHEATPPAPATQVQASVELDNPAFQFLPVELGLDIGSDWRFAMPDAATSRIAFDQRPTRPTTGSFAALMNEPITLPFRPLNGFWADRQTFVLLGADRVTGDGVIERWRLADADGKFGTARAKGHWLLEGLVWAEACARFGGPDADSVNSIAEDPGDANCVFLGTHDRGEVLSVDLLSGQLECMASPRDGRGLFVPALANRSWNGIHAERKSDRFLELTLLRGDSCTLYDQLVLADTDGDGRFDTVRD